MIRRILGLLYLVTFAVMLAAGGAAWWFYHNSTEMITNGVLGELNKHVPGWPITIDRAVLQSDGHLLIRELQLDDPSHDKPLAAIPQVLVMLEGDLIQDRENVRATTIEFIRPEVDLRRLPDGQWNVQGLPPLKTTSTAKAPPVCKIRQGRLRFHFSPDAVDLLPINDDPAHRIKSLNGLAGHENEVEVRKPVISGKSPTLVTFENVDATITPQDDGSLNLEGRVFYGASTSIGLRGHFNPATGLWKLECGSENLHIGNDLIEVAILFVPAAKEKLAQLDIRRRHIPGAFFHKGIAPQSDIQFAGHNMTNGEPNKSTDVTSGKANRNITGQLNPAVGQQTRQPPRPIPGHVEDSPVPGVDLGTDLIVDLHVKVENAPGQPQPVIDADVMVKRGRVMHPILPMPLYSIQGQFGFHNGVLTVPSVTATNGLMHLSLGGDYHPPDEQNRIGQIHLAVTDLLVDEKLKAYLSPGLKSVAGELEFAGVVDLEANGDLIAGRKPDWTIQHCRIRNAMMKPDRFPYPLTDINGTVTELHNQPVKTLRIEMTGKAGQRLLNMTGLVRNPGPENEASYTLRVTDLPLDETLRQAVPDDVAQTFKDMNLQGFADARVQIDRAPGLGQPHRLSLAGRVHRGYANWKYFPYALADVTGDVSMKNDVWTFTNFTGKHAGTTVTGSGVLTPYSSKDRLKVSVQAKNAAFDRSLYDAMTTADPKWKTYWPALNPRGQFDIEANVEMSAAGVVTVVAPKLTTQRAEFKLASFPYQWNNVASNISFDGKDIKIHKLNATHGETRLSTHGTLKHLPTHWVLRLEDIELEDVLPNQKLRDALPVGLQQSMDSLLLKNRFSCFGLLEMKGTYDETPYVTAAFDIRNSLLQNDLVAGLEVNQVTGDVRLRGVVDREGWPTITGLLDIDSANVWGFQVTNIKGPFSVLSDKRSETIELVFGARETFLPTVDSDQQSIPASKRVTGKIFAGIISLDSIVKLSETFDYRSRLTLSRGSLENWARATGYGQADLSGTMNGWLDLQGTGVETKNLVGRGQLWISPARLYELPIFIRIFKAIQFVPPNKTAFRYAFADFNIENERLNFDQIELIGDAISLVGGGYIRFDEVLALDFVSIVPRNQSPLPFINSVLNNPVLRKVTEGLIQVQVSGKVGYPIVKTRTGVPILESTLSGIRRALGSQPSLRFGPPPTFNNRQSLPSSRLRPGNRSSSSRPGNSSPDSTILR